MLGTFNIQYANHLYGKENTVLRGDRDRGDSPYANVCEDNANQILTLVI